MTELVLTNVSRRYGAALAIDRVSLSVEDGEFLTLLGPSGCGKSTTLSAIAGLDHPTGGRITFGDRVLFDAETGAFLPPEARGFGVVFQSYALWPHLSVEDNVGMSLKLRKVPAVERRRRIAETLELVELGQLAKRYPGELSGGQQQRVALARAIVFRPPLLLLDEPLSNLDAQLRQQARSWLKDIQRELGLTTIYVTHDQDEALAMSDRIVVMRGGKVVQLGTPQQIYTDPIHPFAASFIGNANLLEVTGPPSDTSGPCEVRLADGQVVRARTPHAGLPEGAQLLAIRPHLISCTAVAEASEVKVTFGPESYLGDHFEQEAQVAGMTLRLSLEAPQPRGAGRIWIRAQDAVVFAATT
ncbi:ABC transporter ATP-binding protein [Roseicitreum antarcticum]|uniref:Iron(III) transport system ATP-binding protein n=1 Tax=Roseicitreum antarcticum TaxID=564137 RepID=A0A1H2Z4T7_9RHOB|nr:ABC transporter ATP-binding protein [Roseicitreum antarcticum]SDX12420.1 iron(III) transport system ATP-binding protein [Roseicitreum antarcticum]